MRAPALALLLLGTLASAQGIAPDVHWGAYSFPATELEFRVALTLNRFTEFNKIGQRFNDIDETMGFNQLTASLSDRLPSAPDFAYTVWAGTGPTSDQPTRSLQNDFLHNAWDVDRVPVGNVRSDWDYMGGISLTYSHEGQPFASEDWRGRLFAGGGFALGSIYNEPFLHAGAELNFPDSGLKLGIMDRFSLPQEGDAFKAVADRSNITQIYLGYLTQDLNGSNSVYDWFGSPEVGLTLTYDTGLFLESGSRDPIDTWFMSLRVRWPTGFTFEIWNDFINRTDFGPTSGVSFSVDVLTLIDDRLF